MSDATPAAAGPAEAPQSSKKKSHRTRDIVIGGVLTAVVLYAVFGVLIPKVADYQKVGQALANLDPVVFAFLILATILTMVTFWLINMVSLPGLKFWPAAETTQASYAVANTVPAGG